MFLLDISNGTKTIIMLVLLVAVFWFFLIRPQQKQAKKEAAYRDGLRKGDRVMTAGGIHVTVISIEGPMATVELAPGARAKVQTATLNPIPGTQGK